MSGIGPGAFVAVFGGSGVGKDSVLDYARAHLRDDGTLFVRRVITRPVGVGEDHEPVGEELFLAGRYAVAWHAHGLSYGLPIAIDDVIRSGGVAVANVSRTVLGELSERYDVVRLVRVTVSAEVRSARLLARGREDAEAISERIDRPDPAPDVRCDLEIVNDGTFDEAGEQLVAFLRSLVSGGPRTSLTAASRPRLDSLKQ
jgi:ribose 1,5-bisphosphokinase